MAEKKPGSGVLFINDRKIEEKHPDMTGTIITPDGKEYFISAWDKVGRNTQKYQSLAIKEKTPK